jgi:hypothetical protein
VPFAVRGSAYVFPQASWVSPRENKRVVVFHVFLPTCPLLWGPMDSAQSCFYPYDLLLSKFSTGLEEWMDVSNPLPCWVGRRWGFPLLSLGE